jgi:hypothetical protein
VLLDDNLLIGGKTKSALRVYLSYWPLRNRPLDMKQILRGCVGATGSACNLVNV